MTEPVFNFIGQIVGWLEGETYITERNESHYFKIFQGFAISYAILLSLKEKGCKWIQIDYVGKKGLNQFHFTIDEYLNSPLEYTYEFDGVKDLQKIVRIKRKIIKEEQQTL